ncbi:9583_t:CDS:2, partial [Funneliformis mosseae]
PDCITLSLAEDSAETETNISNSQSSTKLSICEVGEAQVLPKDTEVSHDYIVAQDFIQEIKKPNSYSECKDIEKVRPKVLLEKSQGSVPKKLSDVKISILPTSQTSKTNQTNALEMQEKYLNSVEVSTSANVSSF